jgi:hypothetical protein
MPEQSELERSYRRLLLAYPRFYRDERGLEILTTLLDAAKPGQVRATLGEAAHLILSGLRFRLVPPGTAGRIAAGVAALWTAVVLGGVGAYVAWDSSSATPAAINGPRVSALADALVGQPPARVDHGDGGLLDIAYSHKATGRFQTLGAEDLPGVRPVPSGHNRLYEQVDATRGVLDDALRRLRAEGWQTGVITRPAVCACGVFWATRDGLLLRMADSRASVRQEAVTVDFYPIEPNGVPTGAVAGFALGLILAWPTVTWLAHRHARIPRGDRMLFLLFAVPALYACLANTVDNVLSMVPDPDTDSVLLAADLMYPLANQVTNPLAVTVIGVGLAACVGIVVVTPWHRRHPEADPAPAPTALTES